MAELAVAAERLVKRYGHARGLAGLDVEVRRGEVYGFLGPTGPRDHHHPAAAGPDPTHQRARHRPGGRPPARRLVTAERVEALRERAVRKAEVRFEAPSTRPCICILALLAVLLG